MKSVVFFSQVGCFLPFLIIFNLIFGWMFFSFGQWLMIETALVFIFILNTLFVTRKIISGLNKPRDAVDVEGKVE
jgi:hypothetical protein